MTNTDEQDANNTAWFNRFFPIAMSISIAASSWFLNQAWTKISTIETKIQQIELAVAANSGNKFTSNDWVTAKSVMDNERTLLDRRIVRLEETLPIIKDSLVEIKNELKNR